MLWYKNCDTLCQTYTQWNGFVFFDGFSVVVVFVVRIPIHKIHTNTFTQTHIDIMIHKSTRSRQTSACIYFTDWIKNSSTITFWLILISNLSERWRKTYVSGKHAIRQEHQYKSLHKIQCFSIQCFVPGIWLEIKCIEKIILWDFRCCSQKEMEKKKIKYGLWIENRLDFRNSMNGWIKHAYYRNYSSSECSNPCCLPGTCAEIYAKAHAFFSFAGSSVNSLSHTHIQAASSIVSHMLPIDAILCSIKFSFQFLKPLIQFIQLHDEYFIWIAWMVSFCCCSFLSYRMKKVSPITS